MRTVKVEKARLLAKLKENRESHRAEFLKAQSGYRAEVVEQLDKALENARNGKKIITYFNLPAPTDQTSDYDAAIEMLDWAVGDEVELEEQAFRQYILDDWTWKQSWGLSNSVYLSKSL